MNNICEKLLNKGFSYVLFIFFDLSESDIGSDPNVVNLAST